MTKVMKKNVTHTKCNAFFPYFVRVVTKRTINNYYLAHITRKMYLCTAFKAVEFVSRNAQIIIML